MRRPTAAFLALLMAGAAACADGPAGSDGTWVATTDTVGDTVVVRTESGSVWGADARLVEELRIGVVEGEEAYTFGRVDAVAASPAGEIHVLDGLVPVVRAYDSTGTHLRDVGRRGGGPGEFERPRGIVFLPDGGWAVYDDLRRINVYGPDGAVRPSVPVVSTHSTGAPVYPLYADTTGGVYFPDRPEVDGERPTAFVRVPVAGGAPDTVVQPEDPTHTLPLSVPIPGGMSSYTVPFAPALVWTIDPGGHPVTGTGARYAVTVHRPDRPLRIERAVDAPAIPDAERGEREDAFRSGMRRSAPDFRWNGQFPTTKPYFRNLMTGADGRIWVRLHLPSERREIPPPASAEPGTPPRVTWYEPQRWDVFEPDGRYLGAVDMPDDFTFHFARGDHVWGVMRDELGVNYVVRMRIEPGPAAEA